MRNFFDERQDILKKYDYTDYAANLLPCIGLGILCGLFTGSAIFLFRLGAKQAEVLSRFLYRTLEDEPSLIPAGFLILVIAALMMALLHKKIPEAKGGGIPRSEGILRGSLRSRWQKTLGGTVLGSFLSYLCGLPLGSEGPAVLIGTSVGDLCGSFAGKQSAAWSRYIMTGGAGAGFAVATGAPLSAILFALEEIHKRFTPMLVLTVSVSVVSATYVNRMLCSLAGISPSLFHIEPLAEFSLSHAGWLLLLGIIIALAVGAFDASLAWMDAVSKRLTRHLPGVWKLLVVFLVTGVLGIVCSDGIYSGHEVIEAVLAENLAVMPLLLLLALRMVMKLLVTNCGATGGIFIPTLAIGVLTSALAARLMVLCGMPPALHDTVVLLGMCAFIGGTLRAPLMASVLFLELTGQFSDLFCVALVIFTVNTITELLDQTPFYDRALDKLVREQNRGREPIIACFEMKVADDAFVVGKSIRDIMWPASSVVISITRAAGGRRDNVNDGEKKLYAGDTLVLRCRYFDEAELLPLLHGLVGKDSEILRMNVQR